MFKLNSNHLIRLCIAIFLLISLGNKEAFAQQQVSTIGVNVPGFCNAIAFHQIPSNINYFVGRRLINTTSGDACSGTSWALSLFQMDWSTYTLNFVQDILVPPVNFPSQGLTITSTYDPTVTSYNGQLWIAFECVESGGKVIASSCVAPLSSSDFSINLSRATLVVTGSPAISGDTYSASVPKIFVYQGAPYLYWSVVHAIAAADGQLPADITTRGALLTQETSGLQRMWVSGSATTAASTIDSSLTTEVLGVNTSSPISNGVADSFDVHVSGTNVLLTSSIGGTGCAITTAYVYGCYRLAIREASSPLGHDIFNNTFLDNVALPFNPLGYSKFITDPSGNQHIFGYFSASVSNGSPLPTTTVPTGQAMFAIDPATFEFSSSDPTPLPSPSVITAYLPNTFDTLQQFFSSCDASNPIPNPQNLSCQVAVKRYCVSQGYGAGGVLEEFNGNNADVACATSAAGPILNVDISALAAFQSACTTSNLASDSCNAGIADYCGSIGYSSGGFGPEEVSGNTVSITCLNSSGATIVASTYSSLSQANSSCTASSWVASGSCLSAVDRVCAGMGYLSGYGILQHSGNAVVIGCFNKPAG